MNFTLDITVSEAGGYPLLGLFLLFLRRRLADKVGDPNLKVYVHHQTTVWTNSKRSQDPSTDALLMFVPIEDADANAVSSPDSPVMSLVDENRVSLVFYEYKPRVSIETSVDMAQMCELFIQAFYSLQHFQLGECIFCLTDMNFGSISVRRRSPLTGLMS